MIAAVCCLLLRREGTPSKTKTTTLHYFRDPKGEGNADRSNPHSEGNIFIGNQLL
jgi:hypothetical protein